MSYIYLASPYSDPSPAVRKRRFLNTQELVAKLAKDGSMPVFSPIVHWHEVAVKFQLPTDAQWWDRINVAMQKHASELWVYKLEGWERSVGVEREIKLATELHQPIVFLSA